MTSPFEKAPLEVLECIISYTRDEDDLRQLQRTNKRCQFIAEKHLFRDLVLSSDLNNAEYMMGYAHFLLKPRRCKLVKHLCIEEGHFVDLDDSFFSMFCNIEVVQLLNGVDWQHFIKTFTPERCRLKKIMYRCRQESDVQLYVEALQSHSQTLEILDFSTSKANVSSQLIETFRKSSTDFPRLKSLSFNWSNPKLQELCGVIDKCPSLENLTVKLRINERITPYVPTEQHRQPLKIVSLDCSSVEFLDLCTYFTAKFPNVREWKMTNFDSMKRNRQDVPPFEKYVDFLRLVMHSMKAEFKILATHSSVFQFCDFLEQYNATNFQVEYSYSRTDPNDNKVIIELAYCQNTMTSLAKIVYPLSQIGHLDLLEKYGHKMQQLKLALPRYNKNNTQEIGTHYDLLQHGAALAHVLDNCPALLSLAYKADVLDTNKDLFKANKSLKKIVLECTEINREAFSCLSQAAPNVTDLTIRSSFEEDDDYNKLIIIDMPSNKFDRLVLIDEYFFGEREAMMVQITSPVRPNTRYYIQTEAASVVRISNEQEHHVCSEDSHLKVVITCQGIKYLEYASNETRLLQCTFDNGIE